MQTAIPIRERSSYPSSTGICNPLGVVALALDGCLVEALNARLVPLTAWSERRKPCDSASNCSAERNTKGSDDRGAGEVRSVGESPLRVRARTTPFLGNRDFLIPECDLAFVGP
jgi:hypothetical protein